MKPPPADLLRKAAGLAGGAVVGAYEIGKESIAGLYSLATTHPVTSAQNIGVGLARMVDDAIEAEDTPAYVHLNNTRHSIANASAYEIGHALGRGAGSIGVAIAPGAIVTKISSASRLGRAGKVATISGSSGARFSEAASSNYRATFFDAYPALKNKVVVHHAVEKQVLDRFPGKVTEGEMHSLDNLRGVPIELNSDLHLSKIRTEWNQFYKSFEARGVAPTKDQLLRKATEIDARYGPHFNPPR